MNETVRVYYNLHRKLWSVQHKVPGKGWRILGYARAVRLWPCRFIVNEAARQRVIATRRKNVHAYAEGELVSAKWVDCDFVPVTGTSWHQADNDAQEYLYRAGFQVRYNPYEAGYFFDGNHKPVDRLTEVIAFDNYGSGHLWGR